MEAKIPEQKLINMIPYLVAAGAFIIVFVITAATFARKIKIKRIQYGKEVLIIYFLSVMFITTIRTLDLSVIEFIEDVEGCVTELIQTFPLLFVFTASVAFLEYMISSFYTSFQHTMKNRYLIYKKINFILLVTFWLIEFPVLVVFICENYFKGTYVWFNVFHFIFLVSCFLVAILTLPIVISYIKELRRFRITFQGKKISLFLIVVVIMIQVVAKILNSAFTIADFWKDLRDNSEDMPYFQIGQALYVIISEVLPLLSYALYVRRDASQLMVVESTMLEGDTKLDYCSAALIEEHLLKRFNEGI